MITIHAGADTGFVVKGGVDKIIEAGGLGAALRPPVGPGQSPGGGPGGEAPGSSWVFVYFEGKTRLKIVVFENFRGGRAPSTPPLKSASDMYTVH